MSTDEEKEVEPVESQEVEEVIVNSLPVDWVLQRLIYTAESSNISIPITLQVGGLLVTGRIGKRSKYFEYLGNSIGSGLRVKQLTPEEEPALEEMRASLSQSVSKWGDDSTVPASLAEGIESIGYIHVENVRFLHNSGAPIPSTRGVWWRGRLESVDGFILGELMTKIVEDDSSD